ncbi:DUF2057 domain-containing protein [Motilimonas sp. 1_MG-2023]|uniref:YccT family protein n=1 Tax=Motilimonas sp. 1_MG-2023 TaxID=3062672 RepID=UPI0026E285BC|nr:DUF2057 domain-containing protein [Motilimonas sp. 1_MG-2023]MDO6525857.1 DUF2057 domain-containing protein [Motilimonas sp. 1_MG-2023]
MKRLNQAMAFIVISCSAFIASATELNVPNMYEILVVNGQESGNVFFKNDRSITLADEGKQQVVLRFAAPRGVVNTEDMRGIAKSQPIVLTFSTDGLSHIRVEKPHLYTAKSVDKYAKNPVFTLVDQDGKSVPLVQDELFKEGVQLTRDFEQEVQAYNQSKGVAALVMSETVIGLPKASTLAESSQVESTTTSSMSSSATATSSAFEMTQQTFSQLTDTEKKAFLQWALEQM